MCFECLNRSRREGLEVGGKLLKSEASPPPHSTPPRLFIPLPSPLPMSPPNAWGDPATPHPREPGLPPSRGPRTPSSHSRGPSLPTAAPETRPRPRRSQRGPRLRPSPETQATAPMPGIGTHCCRLPSRDDGNRREWAATDDWRRLPSIAVYTIRKVRAMAG